MRDFKFRTWIIAENKFAPKHLAMAIDIFTKDFAYRRKEVIVMEYIGLKDINDKEIYEGDIVKGFIGDKEFIGICHYDKKLGSYIFGNKKNTLFGKTKVTASRLTKKEVLGNYLEDDIEKFLSIH